MAGLLRVAKADLPGTAWYGCAVNRRLQCSLARPETAAADTTAANWGLEAGLGIFLRSAGPLVVQVLQCQGHAHGQPHRQNGTHPTCAVVTEEVCSCSQRDGHRSWSCVSY